MGASEMEAESGERSAGPAERSSQQCPDKQKHGRMITYVHVPRGSVLSGLSNT